MGEMADWINEQDEWQEDDAVRDNTAIMKPSEWQSVVYRCLDCKHEGICSVMIGEHPYCVQCGSTDLVKREEIRDGGTANTSN